MSDQNAPGELEFVRQFVNTLELDNGIDALASDATLSRWLESHGSAVSAKLDDGARARLATVREALRMMLLANNNGDPPPPAALDDLNREASKAEIGLRFEAGGASYVSRASGVDSLIGRLLATVGESMRDGTWPRLKACLADDCLWAFYDHSRNHSGTWCSMKECGNRAKARAFRERRRRQPGGTRSR